MISNISSEMYFINCFIIIMFAKNTFWYNLHMLVMTEECGVFLVNMNDVKTKQSFFSNAKLFCHPILAHL